MKAQPNNPHAVVHNISNTNGNNYVNHTITATTLEARRAECPTEQSDSQKQARPHCCLLLLLNTMSHDYLTPLV